MLIVLVAGMASGKNKIAETLNIYGVKSLVSTTSRPKRKGEEEGVEYYFKTKEELIDMICNDKVVEYRIYDTQYGKWYYCLEKEEVAEKCLILIVVIAVIALITSLDGALLYSVLSNK